MTRRLTKLELLLVAGAVALGCFLRVAEIDRVAVEHFDEGVYSSAIWYQQLNDGVYPSRHLYAPPALPVMIGTAGSLVDPQLAPFVPGLLTGVISILIVWGFSRAAFGMVSGVVAAMLAALSDFHILYSRMALTDVPALMWIVLAVWIGVAGIDRSRIRTMVFAGLACGCAWWTKYTGWLPLAIVSSGSLFWWTIGGRHRCGIGRLIALNGTMAVVACMVWSPWWWELQNLGGYAAVASNHDAYRAGWNAWSENLTTQITWYSITDSWLSALAIALGVICAGSSRWITARRSTWNQSAAPQTGVTPALLARFVGAAVILSIATLTIGSFGVLAALSVGGTAGIFLWPAIPVRNNGQCVAVPAKSDDLPTPAIDDSGETLASAGHDPRLAACVLTAWFCGLLVALPTYTPFPRLLLPLLAAIWVAAAAGIGWWVEACVGVARRSALSGSRAQLSSMQLPLTVLVLVAVSLAAWKLNGGGVPRSRVHDSRVGLRAASLEVAGLCRRSAGADSAEVDASPDTIRFIVYAYGEPAVLFHLNQDGIAAQPVQDMLFPAARYRGQKLPTFLVFGPNALRTPGFMYDWVDVEHQFEHVGDVTYSPGDIVLYNLFSPQWILEHPGSERDQRLEVYRLR